MLGIYFHFLRCEAQYYSSQLAIQKSRHGRTEDSFWMAVSRGVCVNIMELCGQRIFFLI